MPRPDTAVHVSAPSQRGQRAAGYQTNSAHASQRVIISSPRAAPAKYGAVSGSSTSGSGKSSRRIAMRQRSFASTSVLAI